MQSCCALDRAIQSGKVIRSSEPMAAVGPSTSVETSGTHSRQNGRNHSIPSASIQARHQAFTLLLERQSLHTDDAADLTSRRFTHEQIQQMGAKTLRQGLKLPEAPLGLPGFCSGRLADATMAIWW